MLVKTLWEIGNINTCLKFILEGDSFDFHTSGTGRITHCTRKDMRDLRDKLNELFPNIERKAAQEAVSAISQDVREELLKENAQLKEEAYKWEKRNEQLKKDNTQQGELQMQYTQRCADLQDQQKEISTFEDYSKKQVEAIEQLKKEKEELKKGIKYIRRSHSNLLQQVDDLSNEKDSVDRHNEIISENNACLHKKEIRDIERQLVESKKWGNFNAAKIKKEKQYSRNLKEELALADKRYKKLEQCNDQLDDLQESYLQRVDELKSVKESEQLLADEIEKLNAMTARHVEEVIEFHNQIDSWKKECEIWKGDNAKFIKRNEQLRQDNEQLRKEPQFKNPLTSVLLDQFNTLTKKISCREENGYHAVPALMKAFTQLATKLIELENNTQKKEEILAAQLTEAMKEKERLQIEIDASEFCRKAETLAAKSDL